MTRRAVILLRIAVVVLALLAVGVALVHRYRNAIAIEVANTALAGTGVIVRDAAVASLGADEVTFSNILVELGDGTVLRLEDLTLPVRFRGFAGSEIRIGTVTLLAAADDAAPSSPAGALRRWLEAPLALPGATLSIAELVLPDLPAVRGLRFRADPAWSELVASIEPYEVYAASGPGVDADYRAALRLRQGDNEALTADARIRLGDDAGAEIEGELAAQLVPLRTLLEAVGALPGDIVDLAASLRGPYSASVPAEPGAATTVTLRLGLDDGLTTTYRAQPGAPLTRIVVAAASPVEARFEYPALSWAASTERAELRISDQRLGTVAATLSAVTCDSGPQCRLEFSTRLDALGWREYRLVPMTLRGSLDASGEAVSAEFRAATPDEGLRADLALDYTFATGGGELRIDDGMLSFEVLPPSRLLAQWPAAWQLSGGSAGFSATLRFRLDASPAYRGTIAVQADRVVGHYEDIAFLGVATSFDVELDSAAAPVVSPLSVAVDLIDVGFALEDLHATAEPDIADLAANVTSLTLSTLGGTVSAEPFRYDLDAAANRVVLRLESIQLPLIVGLADLQAVDVTGSVSGTLPVTLAGGKISIDGGRLRNDAPGGVIRYRAGSPAADDQGQLGIVMRTLRNFEYETLSSDVSYTEDGDLKLQMRLAGVNPDVDATQPVILNLGVEDNVPQLLRSLQAARSIEDILEERYSR